VSAARRVRYVAAAVLLGELPGRRIDQLYDLPQRPLPTGSGDAIPPVVHQMWRSNRLGRSHARSLAAFRHRNPDFAFRLYTHEQADAFIDEAFGDEEIADVYHRSLFMPMKADIFRYAVLARHGGVYLDITKELTRPLREVIGDRTGAIIGFERNPMPEPPPAAVAGMLDYPGNQLVQWCLISPPGHPFFVRTLDTIVAAASRLGSAPVANPKAAVIDTSGPRAFTRSVWEVLTHQPEAVFSQAGIDYGEPVFPLHRRAWVCYATRPSYAEARQTGILRPGAPAA